MVKCIMVKPVGDQVVFDQGGKIVPKEGSRVREDQYWFRMKRRGSVEITPEGGERVKAVSKVRSVKGIEGVRE